MSEGVEWGQILGALGQLGSVGGVVIFIVMYRQMTQHVLRAYQVVVDDLGGQIKELRMELGEVKDYHHRELEYVHASHTREFALSEAHRERCEKDLQEARKDRDEMRRMLELLGGRGPVDR